MPRKSKFEQMDYEIEFFERLLLKKPDFTEALEALAEVYTRRGFFDKGLNLDRELKKLRPDDPIVHYNLACSYSLMKEIDKSLETIKQAIVLGYDNLEYLQFDPDLVNLRQDDRFKRFWQELKTRSQTENA